MQNHTELTSSQFLIKYNHLISWFRGCILKEDDIDIALSMTWAYGEFLSLNHNGIYADEQIEEVLELQIIQSGRIELESLKQQRGSGILMLASTLYDSGGHTKVLMTWLELACHLLTHKLVVTGSLTDSIERRVNETGVEWVKITSTGLASIREILQQASGCNQVVLHIHPQDIYAALAARLLAKAGYKVIFYNHADHLFSFGIGAAHLVCEISRYGIEINELSKRVKGQSIWMGVPINKHLQSSTQTPCASDLTNRYAGEKIVLSAGSGYKYCPDNEFVFGKFINQLLASRSDVKVLLVGPTGNEKWWAEFKKNWGARVEFLGILPSWEYAQLLARADIYVDSYPITGGTAFPEALLSGKLCTGLSTPIQGYSLADTLKVATSDDMVVRVNALLDGNDEAIRVIEDTKNYVIKTQGRVFFLMQITEVYRTNHSQVANTNTSISTQYGVPNCAWISERWALNQLIKLPNGSSLASLRSYTTFELAVRVTLNANYFTSNEVIKAIVVFLFTLLPKRVFLFAYSRFFLQHKRLVSTP